MRRRIGSGLAAAVLVLVTPGCSSVLDDRSSPDEDRAERGELAERSPKTDASGTPAAAPMTSPTPMPVASRSRRPRPATDAGPGDRPGGRRDAEDGGGARPPAAAPGPSSDRTDPRADGDSRGERPTYVDIRRAAIAGSRASVSFAIRVQGSIPRPLQGSGSNMTASFRLDMPDGSSRNIYALGDHRGWHAELDSGSFPGSFSISDDTFIWELRWRDLGGRSGFRWFAQTAWTRSSSGPVGDTDYYFDRTPEYEDADYPE